MLAPKASGVPPKSSPKHKSLSAPDAPSDSPVNAPDGDVENQPANGEGGARFRFVYWVKLDGNCVN